MIFDSAFELEEVNMQTIEETLANKTIKLLVNFLKKINNEISLSELLKIKKSEKINTRNLTSWKRSLLTNNNISIKNLDDFIQFEKRNIGELRSLFEDKKTEPVLNFLKENKITISFSKLLEIKKSAKLNKEDQTKKKQKKQLLIANNISIKNLDDFIQFEKRNIDELRNLLKDKKTEPVLKFLKENKITISFSRLLKS
jgi:hypothetical protein